MSTTEDTTMHADESAVEETKETIEEEKMREFVVDLLIMVKSA